VAVFVADDAKPLHEVVFSVSSQLCRVSESAERTEVLVQAQKQQSAGKKCAKPNGYTAKGLQQQ